MLERDSAWRSTPTPSSRTASADRDDDGALWCGTVPNDLSRRLRLFGVGEGDSEDQTNKPEGYASEFMRSNENQMSYGDRERGAPKRRRPSHGNVNAERLAVRSIAG